MELIDRNALKKVTKRLAELDKLIQATFEKSVLGGDMLDTFAEYARKYEAEKLALSGQAKQLSEQLEHGYIGTEHILLGMLQTEDCLPA